MHRPFKEDTQKIPKKNEKVMILAPCWTSLDILCVATLGTPYIKKLARHVYIFVQGSHLYCLKFFQCQHWRSIDYYAHVQSIFPITISKTFQKHVKNYDFSSILGVPWNFQCGYFGKSRPLEMGTPFLYRCGKHLPNSWTFSQWYYRYLIVAYSHESFFLY